MANPIATGLLITFLLLFVVVVLAYIIKNLLPKPVSLIRTGWEHKHMVQQLIRFLRELAPRDDVTLSSSNHTFGLSRLNTRKKLDMSGLDKILGMDADGVVEFEGSCTIENVLKFLAKRGRTLRIIPDLKHLKMGGIVSGIGGGSGSWKEGAFHDAVVDCDLMLASGGLLENISADADCEHAELFRAIPGSLGTLGYITRMRMATIPLVPFVTTTNIRCSSIDEFLRIVRTRGASADFVDGTAFAADHIVCVLGYKSVGPLSYKVWTDMSNFVNHRMYWKALRDVPVGEETIHKLHLMEYIYRWETDLYYTTMNTTLPSICRVEWLRPIVPRAMIPKIKDMIAAVHPVNIDNVCADVMIPMDSAVDFWNFFNQEIQLYPVYLCPARSKDNQALFWTGEPILDFGIGYGVLPESEAQQIRSREQIEQKMLELGGRKLPYSKHSLTEDEFWETRGGPKKREIYDKLRKQYGAEDRFPSVYCKLT